jgi:hypothetical protein
MTCNPLIQTLLSPGLWGTINETEQLDNVLLNKENPILGSSAEISNDPLI